jgi:hypothetical protein
VPAFEADSEVEPSVSGRQTILAAIDFIGELSDLKMCAVPTLVHVTRACQSTVTMRIARTRDLYTT